MGHGACAPRRRMVEGFEVPEQDYARGKRVRGPKGIDKVPAALTEGEYVIKRPSAKKIGYKKLDYMNREGKIPMRKKMQLGGRARQLEEQESAALGVAPSGPDAIDRGAMAQKKQGVVAGMAESIKRRFFKRGGAVKLGAVKPHKRG